MQNSGFVSITGLKSIPQNPSLPPFSKGRRHISPFEKGGLRGISEIIWQFWNIFHKAKQLRLLFVPNPDVVPVFNPLRLAPSRARDCYEIF
jgi:hypothetical protein